jgi:hypothetical protein
LAASHGAAPRKCQCRYRHRSRSADCPAAHPGTRWNGAAGGKYTRFKNDSDKLISFEREKNGNKVIVVLNPSPRATTGTVEFGTQTKTFFKFSNGAKTKLGKTQKFSMKAWGYEIYSTVKP